jgi:pimeloyl-ACP methyl ester carboxylesterase
VTIDVSNTIVRSADGTRIALTGYGDGPPLVVVPGALCDQTAWTACAPLMATGRSVQVIDRRGRGSSGDSPTYEPDREVEDVLAVVAALGPKTDLLGHSSGAILALMAAEHAPEKLRRVVLYEPPLFFDEGDAIPADLPERLEALLADGDEDGALETFLREGPRAQEAEIQDLRSHHAAWPWMLALIRTIPYDARIVRDYDMDLRRLGDMRAPTFMLIGSDSPPRVRRASQHVAHALPDVRIEELPGQGHQAQLLAPEVLARAVDRFLTGD